MRVVTLEEHFIAPYFVEKIPRDSIAKRGWPLPGSPAAAFLPLKQLQDIGKERLADMDAAGITLQVLSASGPGADLADASRAPVIASGFNNYLAQAIDVNPTRFAGFAHLPMTAPEAAADELERTVTNLKFKGACINGTTDGKFLDDARFYPILQRAERLDVPIYIHPNLPPPSVREAYYNDLPGGTDVSLALAGWGWHAETAVHVLRLVLAGTLDRFPKLKLIIGHMGEGLPTMIDRCDAIFTSQTSKYLSRTVSRTILDQVWVTTSGFFSATPFYAALSVFGVDRMLFSVDYPYSSNEEGRAFLDSLDVSEVDRRKIAADNADALLKLA